MAGRAFGSAAPTRRLHALAEVAVKSPRTPIAASCNLTLMPRGPRR